jgi:Protein of unknown function (DUF732)
MKTTLTAFVVAAVLASACSKGDNPDDRFVAALNSHSIPGDRGVEVTAAHEQCEALRSVANADVKTNKNPPMSLLMDSGQKIKDIRDRLTGQGLSPDQFMQAMVDADETLCPDVKDTLNRLENTP